MFESGQIALDPALAMAPLRVSRNSCVDRLFMSGPVTL
jgi:hypothetical protein